MSTDPSKALDDKSKKTALDDKAKKTAEELDKTNADPSTAPAGNDLVYVFANLQSGQSFKLNGGKIVTINGFPVSQLKGIDGQNFAGGKYGVTQVSTEQWREVMKVYGKMKIFQSGLVFDAPTLEQGKAMARERGGLRHGYEPIDPESDRTKTKPKTGE